MAADKFVTVRVRESTHARAKRLVARIEKEGWSVIRTARDEKASIAGVIEEALDKLEEIELPAKE